MITMHGVRLGLPHWQVGYKCDGRGVRYWWLDAWRWRLCLIRHAADPR